MLMVVIFIIFITIIYEKRDIVSTNWSCNIVKTSFISNAYKEYKYISEEMTMSFISDEIFSIREFVEVLDVDGFKGEIENVYYGTYKLSGDNITLKFKKVDQKYNSNIGVVNKDYLEYEGIEIKYSFYTDDKFLFFFSENKSEIHNFTCFINN
ncbi:TPA: hypothetical protein ACPJ2D_004264 [Vibrio alginolyticus]